MEATDFLASAEDAGRRLIGRERERAALGAVLARMRAGHGGLVLISGEAGIGKTTLVSALCRDAQQQGLLIISGHCYDLTVPPPYGPWLEISDAYHPSEGWPALPPFVHDREALEALGDQGALFRQSAAFYTALASVQPLVLILEDLQWADEPSLELLRFLCRGLADQPMLVLVTYRDDEIAADHPLYRLVPLLVREAGALRIRLGRFDRIDTGELIRTRYELDESDSDRLLAYLQERAEGNPFFAEELLRSLESDGILRSNGAGWQLGDLARAALPALLRQVVDARLRKLGIDTRRLLALGAILGESVPLELWRQIAELPEDEFAEGLRPAIEQHILVEDDRKDRLRFSHALIQAALYDGTGLPQRRLWHRAAAEAMLGMTQPDPSLVADHFRRAGDRRAAEWLSRAGHRAQRLYAWGLAVERYEAAHALLDDDAERARERGWLCYRLGWMLCYQDGARSRHYLDEAVLLGEVTDDALLSACAMTERGHQYGIEGDYQRGLPMMADGLAAFDQAIDQPRDAAQGQPSLVSLKYGMDELRGLRIAWFGVVLNPSEALRQAEELLPPYADAAAGTATGASDPARSLDARFANAYLALCFCHGILGHVEQAQEAFKRSRQPRRNPFVLGRAIDTEFSTLTYPYFMDQPDLVERQAEEAERCYVSAVEGGIVAGGVYSPTRALANLIHSKDWDTTVRRLAQAAVADVDAVWRVHSRWVLGLLARSRGETARAWDEIRAVLPQGTATPFGNQHAIGALWMIELAVDLALDAGDPSSAHAWLECHDHWLNQHGSVVRRASGALHWGRYYRHTGDAALAHEQAERALTFAGTPRQPLDLLAAHRFLGQLDLDARDVAGAEQHLAEALRLSDACAAPYERALTLLMLAHLHLAAGNADDARAALAEVRAICGPLGAAPALTEADAIETDIRSAQTPVVEQTGLTAREMDVLRLVAQGLTDAEVAERLYVSRRTVGTHLSSIYGKLGLRSRTEATRFALEHRLD